MEWLPFVHLCLRRYNFLSSIEILFFIQWVILFDFLYGLIFLRLFFKHLTLLTIFVVLYVIFFFSAIDICDLCVNDWWIASFLIFRVYLLTKFKITRIVVVGSIQKWVWRWRKILYLYLVSYWLLTFWASLSKWLWVMWQVAIVVDNFWRHFCVLLLSTATILRHSLFREIWWCCVSVLRPCCLLL